MNMNIGKFDPLDKEFLADWAPILNRLRIECPVYRHEDTLSKTISIFRYEDVQNLLSNSRDYSNVRGSKFEKSALGDALSLIGMDPPDHTRLRKTVNKVFTPRMIRELQGDAEQNANEIFDEILEQEEFDVVEECAGKLTVYMIAQLVGVPRGDLVSIRDWTMRLAEHDGVIFFVNEERPDLERIVFDVNEEMQEYFVDKVDDRLKHPRDDVLTQLIQSGLSRHEAISFAKILVIAGNETTMSSIAHMVRLLIDYPDQQQILRDDPELIQNTVDEVLRFAPVLRGIGRHAREDHKWHGVEVKQGDWVYGWIAAANRDPDFIERPDEFDLTRPQKRHLTFGHGIHTCLGNALARLEMSVFLETLLKRTRAIERVSDAGMEYVPSPTANILRHQYVRFHAA